MRNLVLLGAVFGLIAIFAISCEKQPPVVNGKDVLTIAQYNQLIGTMKADLSKTVGNTAEAQKSDLFAEGSRSYREDQYAKAATSFESLLKESPDNSRAWFMLGSCQEKMGNLQAAQQSYKKSYDIMVKQGYIGNNRSTM